MLCSNRHKSHFRWSDQICAQANWESFIGCFILENCAFRHVKCTSREVFELKEALKFQTCWCLQFDFMVWVTSVAETQVGPKLLRLPHHRANCSQGATWKKHVRLDQIGVANFGEVGFSKNLPGGGVLLGIFAGRNRNSEESAGKAHGFSAPRLSRLQGRPFQLSHLEPLLLCLCDTLLPSGWRFVCQLSAPWTTQPRRMASWRCLLSCNQQRTLLAFSRELDETLTNKIQSSYLYLDRS